MAPYALRITQTSAVDTAPSGRFSGAIPHDSAASFASTAEVSPSVTWIPNVSDSAPDAFAHVGELTRCRVSPHSASPKLHAEAWILLEQIDQTQRRLDY